MNEQNGALSFLKLRVADCSWIVFDKNSTALGDASAHADTRSFWPDVARGICDRNRGASAEGIVAIQGDGDQRILRFWDAKGRACAPSAASLLCVSRFLFDTGMAEAESVTLRTLDSEAEVIFIDSRNFSVSPGIPLRPDGRQLVMGSAPLGEKSHAPGAVVVNVLMGNTTLGIALFDTPPRKRNRQSLAASAEGAASRIEVLVVSRNELRIRRGSCDPVLAAAAAVSAAAAADFSDREATVIVGGTGLVVQWSEDGPVFVAAAPEYCLSGEYWATDQMK